MQYGILIWIERGWQSEQEDEHQEHYKNLVIPQ